MSTTAPSQVTTHITTITPQQAEALLKSNVDNRKVRPKVVTKYAEDMRDGNWALNGATIAISDTGIVIDGQHRLLGCVEAGVPFTTVVIRGVAFQARETLDTGSKRTFSDVLRWRGEVQVTQLAAAIEAGMSWDETGNPSHQGTLHSNATRVAWLDANPDIREAVRIFHFSGPPWRFPASVGAPLYMRAARIAPDDAPHFAKLLQTGSDIAEDHPVAKLRAWLFATSATRVTHPREEFAALGVKAWNGYISGRPIKVLKWRRGGASPEEFPTMIGPDGRSYEEIVGDPLTALSLAGTIESPTNLA
jgi:hypothetical protein